MVRVWWCFCHVFFFLVLLPDLVYGFAADSFAVHSQLDPQLKDLQLWTMDLHSWLCKEINVKIWKSSSIFILVKHSILGWRFRVAARDFGFRVYTTPIGLHYLKKNTIESSFFILIWLKKDSHSSFDIVFSVPPPQTGAPRPNWLCHQPIIHKTWIWKYFLQKWLWHTSYAKIHVLFPKCDNVIENIQIHMLRWVFFF